jgi:DNA ligase D-like protein (predicted polymerase)
MAARRRTREKAAPGYIPELDPSEANAPPAGAGWVHEVKWDGFRAQAHLRGRKVTTYSRSGLDWTDEFDTVSEAVAKLKVKSAVIDGEVVVIGPGGKPDFQALRRNLDKHSKDLQYYAFDLLELNGKDFRGRPLIERKAALEKLLARVPDRIRYVEHFDTDPRQVMQAACDLGLEGIVSKRTDSPYESGRRESYHKRTLPRIPDEVHSLTIEKREGGEGQRVWVDSVDGLVALARGLDAVELHPWNATVDDIEVADQVVLDLDPGEGIDLPFVVDTALRVRELMEDIGLKPWPKATGGKGYHIMAPLPRPMSHDQARTFAKDLAERIAGTDRRYTTSAAMGQRRGHLFIDYLRNGRGSTAVGTWSPRARPGFPIARPVTWKQIEKGITPSAFSIDNPGRTAATVRS